MPKRAAGQGTVRKRPDGRYEVRLLIGDKRRSFYGETQREALLRAKEAERSHDSGLRLTDITVSKYLAHWLEFVAARRVKPGSLQRYQYSIDLLLPYLGTLKLKGLTPLQ